MKRTFQCHVSVRVDIEVSSERYLRNSSTTAERNTKLSRPCYCLQRSWKQAEVSKRWETAHHLPMETSPALGPAGSQPGRLASFCERPLGWVSVDHLRSLSQFILFGPLFLLLLYYVLAWTGEFSWSNLFLCWLLSLLFICQWFPSKSPFLSLSFYGLLWHTLIRLCR